MDDDKHSLASMQTRCGQRASPQMWQSLAEIDHPDRLRQWAADEFGDGASEWPDGASRRQFLQLMGASLVMAGAAGCSDKPAGDVVPYVQAPEDVVAGQSQYYASAITLDGYANGVLVESRAGRPIKVEGNPDHPTSLGATDAFAQAATWGLYDPGRSQSILESTDDNRRVERKWADLTGALRNRLGADELDDKFDGKSGDKSASAAGVRILTETVTSPTLAGRIDAFLQAHPRAKWHRWSPISRDNIYAGARRAFGRPVHARYHFDKADTVVAVDADFFSHSPGRLLYARQWARRRAVRAPDVSTSRMYAVEATLSVTGSMADNRLPIKPGRIEGLMRRLAQTLGVTTAAPSLETTADEDLWVDQLAADLRSTPGRSLVVAGLQQPPATHALVHAINQVLGNIGTTVEFGPPPAAGRSERADATGELASLRRLAADIDAGQVDTLVMLGGNPVYNAPADLGFGQLVDDVDLSVHLSLYDDETSRRSTWHVPRVHPLEAWSDARATDGTATIIQPLIAPLYGGRSSLELVEAMAGQTRSSHEIVMDHWRQQFGDQFRRRWRQSLHDGVVADTRFEAVAVRLRDDFDRADSETPESSPQNDPSTDNGQNDLTIIFAPDPSVWDGRFSNLGLLQELPKPMSSLTWDNAALVSPATAQRLQVSTGDVVELHAGARRVEAPILVQPGQADGCITARLGWGKTAGGSLGQGRGFDAYRLRTSGALWFSGGLELRKTPRTYELASTQLHHRMHHRPIVKHADIDAFDAEFGSPRAALAADKPDDSLYPEYDYDGHAWAMNVDQTLCTGCQACVAACDVENNVPIVGKEQVLVAREMHWLRVDTYYDGSADNPAVYHQPVPCMHCEKAPCELVCPVEATAHSSEGINEMTYNRCIGTRYCSNNCPYKVRRFNFLDYTGGSDHPEAAVLELKHNPEVTVRSRGVMEKCTYCIQRINTARVDAQTHDRPIRDGDIQTACQQVCPTQAIIFGDKNDPDSEVVRLKKQPHDYALLESLNTQPRTTYLAAIDNPNDALQGDSSG